MKIIVNLNGRCVTQAFSFGFSVSLFHQIALQQIDTYISTGTNNIGKMQMQNLTILKGPVGYKDLKVITNVQHVINV